MVLTVQPILQVTPFCTVEQDALLMPTLENCTSGRWHPAFTDITARGADKGKGLKVDVKVNEAEMKITQAEDGLVLSKMLLCQLCGIPMNQQITLADEDKESLALSGTPVDTEQQRVAASDSALNTRPELRMLQNTLFGELVIKLINDGKTDLLNSL